MNLRRFLCVCCLMILVCNARRSAGLNCSQCNIRFLGVRNECNEPRNVSDCIGCMKTIAKVKLRDSGYIDGWEKPSVVISRFCITLGNINVKPAGCYKQVNNGGYTERCYCYTDYCNSGASRLASTIPWTLFSSPLSFSRSSIAAIHFLLLMLIIVYFRH